MQELETSPNDIRFLSVSLSTDGKPQISLRSTRVEYENELPPGMLEFETFQIGSCTSELYYYHPRYEDQPSRFELDSTDETKRELYLKRNMASAVHQEPENIAHFQDLLTHTMFHEVVGRVLQFNKDDDRPAIPVQMYRPKIQDGKVGFIREVVETNFQENIQPGSLIIRNPAIICDKHSRADNINPETGWPYQCHRNQEEGHEPKGTIGHTEFPGGTMDGIARTPADAVTPVPQDLQTFIEKDIVNRAFLLTCIEPMGCVFDAFGTFLQSEERPESIVIIGDGPNALLTTAFCQVFAPDAELVIVGKHKAKLNCMSDMNPDKITTITTDGNDYSNLASILKMLNGKAHAGIVMPTVSLDEETVAPFVEDDGTLIWWAASVSEVTDNQKLKKRYHERFPYGGAPRAEFSAMLLMEYFIKERPEVIESILKYPGVNYSLLHEDAASVVEEWLTNNGRLVREIETADGIVNMSLKPVINTARLLQYASYLDEVNKM